MTSPVEIRVLVRTLRGHLTLRDRKVRFRVLERVASGQEVVTAFLVVAGEGRRSASRALAQKLLDAGELVCVTSRNDGEFRDKSSVYYRFADDDSLLGNVAKSPSSNRISGQDQTDEEDDEDPPSASSSVRKSSSSTSVESPTTSPSQSPRGGGSSSSGSSGVLHKHTSQISMLLSSARSKTIRRSRSFADAETLMGAMHATAQEQDEVGEPPSSSMDGVREEVRSVLKTARFTSLKGGGVATEIPPALLQPAIRLRFMKAADFEMEPAKRLLGDYASWWKEHRPAEITLESVWDEYQLGRCLAGGADKEGRRAMWFTVDQTYSGSVDLSITLCVFVLERLLTPSLEPPNHTCCLVLDLLNCRWNQSDLEVCEALISFTQHYLPGCLECAYLIGPKQPSKRRKLLHKAFCLDTLGKRNLIRVATTEELSAYFDLELVPLTFGGTNAELLERDTLLRTYPTLAETNLASSSADGASAGGGAGGATGGATGGAAGGASSSTLDPSSPSQVPGNTQWAGRTCGFLSGEAGSSEEDSANSQLHSPSSIDNLAANGWVQAVRTNPSSLVRREARSNSSGETDDEDTSSLGSYRARSNSGCHTASVRATADERQKIKVSLLL
eukprot:CAMPEP_0177680400 /NCGR_PEP_ID=MMETSP0447-20121125/30152_1 /TAXON_ID=0 /ORGANISM="Stygamoeba regulata, Strain BSH-02190019" /LENGTH=615 /DNA_ID=CAMNT_0019189727 /DNA_START=54 /DNA_END=1901 /DNA_ORIENTATION=-